MKTTGQTLDIAQAGPLTFEPADPVRFPALRLAREALQAGGSAPTILNAANEIAVSAFLDRRIGFLDIAATVERVMQNLPSGPLKDLDDVMRLTGWVASRRGARSRRRYARRASQGYV